MTFICLVFLGPDAGMDVFQYVYFSKPTEEFTIQKQNIKKKN